jgi:two-component system cell cycle response regulator
MQTNTTIEPAVTNSPQKHDSSVLLAEDSALYRHMIEGHLTEWGFQLVCAKDGKAAWKILTQPGAPKLALLDWVLPEIEGVELCRRLRACGHGAYTYTILLTSNNGKQEMLQAMDAGADDFLAKPFDPLELKARLLVGKRIVDLQQKLVSANNALQFAACHDFLTGAWNRAEILAFLQRELARSRRDRTFIGIVLLDVDHFKSVNDKYGHETGDVVLKEIAARLSASSRKYDGVGRYGGEEFLLILPGCDLETTVRRADQIRNSIATTPFSTSHGSLTVTVSMGVTVADCSMDPESLLRDTDLALYQAKHKGRNRVERTHSANPVAASAVNAIIP